MKVTSNSRPEEYRKTTVHPIEELKATNTLIQEEEENDQKGAVVNVTRHNVQTNIAIDNNKAQCPETEEELISMLEEERSPGKALIFQNTGLGHNLINTRLTPSRYNYIKRYYIDLDSPLPDKEICRWHKRGLCKFKEDCRYSHEDTQPFLSEAQFT